jgi:hypothetical protein
MTKIETIRDRDKRLFAITEGIHIKNPDALRGTKFEKTTAVMASLIDRMGFLKTGILDMAEADNLYSMYVLFRVFLEHILKVNALFLKAVYERSDMFAEKYLQLQIVEAFKYLKAYQAAGLEIGENPGTVLDQWFPIAKSLSNKDVRELEDPFHYRQLIKTIRELIETQVDTHVFSFLNKIIPNYSELSGFVHGGPTAEKVLAQFYETDKRQNEILRIADLTVSMFYSAERWLLILASSVCSEFKPVCDALDYAIRSEEVGRSVAPCS